LSPPTCSASQCDRLNCLSHPKSSGGFRLLTPDRTSPDTTQTVDSYGVDTGNLRVGSALSSILFVHVSVRGVCALKATYIEPNEGALQQYITSPSLAHQPLQVRVQEDLLLINQHTTPSHHEDAIVLLCIILLALRSQLPPIRGIGCGSISVSLYSC
jgi:hypothetical protein